MPPPSFLVLFFAAVLSHCLDRTPNSTFSVRNCQFFLDPNSQNFTFLYCSSSKLVHQTEWQVCIYHCCGMAGEDYPLPDQDTLLQCEDSSNWSDDLETIRTVKLTSITVACSVIFASLFILLCKVFASCCNNRVAECQGHPETSTRWSQDVRFISKGLKDTIWRSCEGRTGFDGDRICSICLQSNCLAEIQCGHGYHANCIGLWLKKSHFCPLCHMEDINLIRKYCAGCQKQYLLMKKGTVSTNCGVLDELKCQNCQQEKQGVHDVGSSKRRIESLSQKDEASQSHFQIIVQ